MAEFVADEYLAMKAAQLNSIKQDGKSDWTADSLWPPSRAPVCPAWTTMSSMATKEGMQPLIRPGRGQILPAKADAMNAAAGEGEKSDWTAAEIKTAINDANMSVLDHFETYAGTAANEADKADYPVDHKPFQFDLTTDVDTVAGTAADEIINGATGTSRVATLNDGDMIDGGAGTDHTQRRYGQEFHRIQRRLHERCGNCQSRFFRQLRRVLQRQRQRGRADL